MRSDQHHKVAYLIDDLGLGGAQTLLANLVSSLPDQYVPLVFCLSEKDRPYGDQFRKKGIPVFLFKRNFHLDLPRLLKIKEFLAAERIDLVHSYLHASNVYAYLAARMLRLPVILSLQSNQPRIGRFQNRALSWVFRRADRVMVNSRAGKRYLLERAMVPADRIVLIKNCFPGDHISAPAISPLSNNNTIGFVGRLDNNVKRIDLLLRALPAVLEQRPESRLVLVGTGPDEQMLRDLAKELAITDRVEFRGAVPDVLAEMRKFRCLVLPSAFEGTPMVVIEALSLGVPVIATDVGDIGELVLDRRTGRILEDVSPAGLARLILDLVDDDALIERVRVEGPSLVQSTYSVASFQKQLTSLYDSLLSPSHPE